MNNLKSKNLLTIHNKILATKKQRKITPAIFLCSFCFITLLFISPDNPSLGQIIRGHLNRYFVTRQNPDKVHAELSADVGENLMSVLQLYLKHGVRQLLHYCSFDFNYICF